MYNPCLSPCATLCHLGTLPARRPPAVPILTSRSADRVNPILFYLPSMWYCDNSNQKHSQDITGCSHLSCCKGEVGDRLRRAGKKSRSTPQLPALLTDPYILALGTKSPSDFGQPECCIKQYISICRSVALSNTLVSNCGT